MATPLSQKNKISPDSGNSNKKGHKAHSLRGHSYLIGQSSE
jgi:hypothetical protein